MSLFGFFKKDKIENENKSKPFDANTNADDRRDWFSRTRPWHKVSPVIIDALIDRYGDNPMFEVFVITSMKNDLVSDYETHGKTEFVTEYADTPSIVLAQISGILYSKGMDAAQKYLQLLESGGSLKKQTTLYGTTFDCLESSVIISDCMVASYVTMAKLKILCDNPEDASGFIESGLNRITKLKEYSDAMSKSKIDSISKAPQDIDEMEQMLLSMKDEI